MTSQKKTYITHIVLTVVLVVIAFIPVGSWVMAQEELKQFSSSQSILTSDFGIESPAGMAYSPETDSFMIWASDHAFHVIKSQEEVASKINLIEPVEDPLSIAFNDQSKSLFILSASNTELAKVDIGQSAQSDITKKPATRFDIRSFEIQDAQGITFDSATGRLFILDARRSQVLVVSPHPEQEFDGVTAQANNKIQRLGLESLSHSGLRGIAFNPNNGHIYVGSPDERKVYELTETAEQVSTYDVSNLNLENPATMLFAPSRDVTDDPTIMDLYILDSGQVSTQDSVSATDQRNASQMGKIVELSMQVPAALPPGTTLLPTTLVRTIDTSNASWNPSAPDPAGIDYWPLTGRLLIVDSEVDEMPSYFQGKNVFQSTTSGTLVATCSTTAFTGEPTGVAINPNNNHIFFPSDFNDSIFEVGLGPDGVYCTADDTVTATNVTNLYNIQDAEDVAYGNNTLFIAGGDHAEVYRIPLGLNGVLGGGDDGAMTHFDTAALGFSDMEALGYNADSNTLFLASPKPTERYLGETTISGMLLRAYDLTLMGTAGNIRSDVTYAPSSQNPGIKSIYIASRGVDNDDSRFENDGKIWEIRLSSQITPTPTVPTAAHVNVSSGGSPVGSHNVALHSSIRSSYPGVNSGPMKVMNTNVTDILASLQVIWKEPGFRASYSELMGLPREQLSSEYWFPWYNNAFRAMDQGFRIANVDTASTTIEVSVGTTVIRSEERRVGDSVRKRYHVYSGPIKILSIDGRNIVTSLRVIWQEPGYRSSYSELMGLPREQLSSEYWFPWYNNAFRAMDQGFRIANVDTASTTIEVSVGTTVI